MRAAPFALLPLLAAAGCASGGDFPSLAERPAERELSGRPTPPCAVGAGVAAATSAAAIPAEPADDPALGGEIARLSEAVRSGQAEFADALPPAERASARAGAAGSETWVEAQQQLSRLEAARARTVDALAELDRLAVSRTAEASSADVAALQTALDEAQALASAQEADVERVRGALPQP